MFATYIFQLSILLGTIIFIIYAYFMYMFKHWERRNIPYLVPTFPNGNNNHLMPRGISIGIQTKRYYEEFKKKKVKYGGIFSTCLPMLVVIDPDYIKAILIKDFQNFVDRGMWHNEKNDPLSANLFSQDGLEWKRLRNRFTPMFSSGKIKMMFRSMKECGQNLIQYIEENPSKEYNLEETILYFSVDVIGTCAFGIECNSFKDKDKVFHRMSRKIFEAPFWLSLQQSITINFPKMADFLHCGVTDNDVRQFFYGLVGDTVSYREKNQVYRPDILQNLIELKNSTDKKMNITMDEMASQVFLFFLAGYETSSSTIIYTLFELSKKQHLQERLRKEITDNFGENGDIDYEKLNGIKYLSQCIQETLRIYPTLVTLNRQCNKDYTFENSEDHIKSGDLILIPVMGIQHDPEFWPNPMDYDPERFNEENKPKIRPGTYIPFGLGPRNCIGMRFALMEVKLALGMLLRKFRFSLADQQPEKLSFLSNTYILYREKSVYLKIENI